MLLLLEACPSFADKWKEHRAYYGDEEDLLYVDLGEFARHLVDLQRSRQTGEFPDVFDVAEMLHLNGDAYVREAATIGLLEGIQNVASHSEIEPEEFVQYLKPESARWWKKLNAFWDGDAKALNSN